MKFFKFNIISFLILNYSSAYAAPKVEASISSETIKLYEKMTGQILNEYNPSSEVLKGLSIKEAAEKITTLDEFQKTKVLSFAAQFADRESEPDFALADDLQTTILGYILYDLDFRGVLFEDRRFSYTNTSRETYLGGQILSEAIKQNESDSDALTNKTAGVQTTNKFGQMNFTAGTTRRQIPYLISKFLCTDISGWKNPAIDDRYVRGDIDRYPGKNHDTYQTQCRSCHAPMDALAGAHANYDYDNNARRTIKGTRPLKKTRGNQETNAKYPSVKFNVPYTEFWDNLLITEEMQEHFGWQGESFGFGPASLGQYFSQAERFKTCMVERVSSEICENGESFRKSKTEVSRLAELFSQNGYNLRLLFADVAQSQECD